MTFYIYRREAKGSTDVLHATGEEFSLAGYNLLHSAWKRQGRPIQKGWRVSSDELIKLHSGNAESYATRRLLVDYHPSNRNRIPVVEILEIFLFSWEGSPPTTVGWTPMMLRLRDVMDEWTEKPISHSERMNRMARIEIEQYGGESVEFLYLKGDEGSWNWGRNGATNAVFLHNEAREYFRRFF